MQDITNRICAYVSALRYDDLPEEAIEQTKLFIADYYAASFAGYRINKDLNEKMLQLLTQMGGCQEAGVLISRQRFPAANAAFMNALYAHGADMDDGNRKAAGHIAAHVMSAVFALAEAEKSSWKDVLLAINVGYDVFNRVVGAAMPGLYNRGFHSTGVGGGIACAAACAKLLGLDHEGIYNAISLAAIQSSGLIIIDESGQSCKPINPANAARSGLLSAQLARLGVESSRNPLESKKGWFNGFGSGVDEELLFDGMGTSFTICESYLKLYPACRHTHCCIDGALDLYEELRQQGLNAGNIKAIKVYIYPSAIKSAGTILRPKSPEEIKFSIHYCMATALLKGQFGLAELEMDYSDAVHALIDKIELIPDESMENRKAGIRGARICADINGGKNFEETLPFPRGEASKPLTWKDMSEKFRQCARGLCSDEQLADFIHAIRCPELNTEFYRINL